MSIGSNGRLSEALGCLSDEDKAFVRNIKAWAEKSEHTYMCRYTSFLDDRKEAIACFALSAMGFERFMLFGGHKDAKRRILAVFSEYAKPEESDFPIYSVTFRYKPCYELTHRDFLGAFMSQEIKRECVGDIVIGNGVCVAFSTLPVLKDITKVGRVGVDVQDGCEAIRLIDTEQKFSDMSGTVASLRLDCIVAFAINTSRSKTSEIICSKQVCVNGFFADDESMRLCEGDVFSVRGHGKFLLAHIGSETRKNRIHIEIKKYI